jgi:hypothetical protein
MENGAKPINPILDWNELKADSAGLTKREYFAGLAMQGLMSNSKVIINDIDNMSACVRIADELLKQLEQ